MILERGEDERQVVIERALRLALAQELEVDPGELEGIEPHAAAAALRAFTERDHEHLPELIAREPSPEQREALIAYGVRAALASELGVGREQVERISVVGAAHALERLRSRRLASPAADAEAAYPAVEEPARLVPDLVLDLLSEQLHVPPSVVADLRVDLAAHILAQFLELRGLVAGGVEPDAGQAQLPDRRDTVARVIRNAIAQQIDVHPRVLGPLDPGAAALLLGRFAESRRMLEVVRANVAVDEVTDALRRSAGEVHLEREIRRARRAPDGRLVVAFIDVDSLKTVNDQKGHSAGDELLSNLVAILHQRLRTYDIVVRWGGDEFLVILPDADVEAADSVMHQVNALFGERNQESFSYGLAALRDGDDAATLVRRADEGLYQAKRQRNATAIEPPAEVEPVPEAEAQAPASGEPVMEPAVAPAPARRPGWWRRFLDWLWP